MQQMFADRRRAFLLAGVVLLLLVLLLSGTAEQSQDREFDDEKEAEWAVDRGHIIRENVPVENNKEERIAPANINLWFREEPDTSNWSDSGKELFKRFGAIPKHVGPVELQIRANPEDSDFLFFVHIPKTGGMTMCGVLRSTFKSPSELVRQQNMVPVGGKDGGKKPEPIRRFWGGRFDPNFVGTSSAVRVLNDMSRAKQMFGGLWGVYGHADVSMESVIEDNLGRNMVTVTVVRDPVHQMLSWYDFLGGIAGMGRSGGHDLRQQRKRNPIEVIRESRRLSLGSIDRNTSFVDFVDVLDEIHLSNYQARAFSGALPYSFWDYDGKVSDFEMVELAKLRLERTHFIGLNERYVDSIVLLQYTLNVTIATLPKSNPSAFHYEMSEEEEEHVRKIQRLDYPVYDYAVELFDRRYKAMVADCEARGVPIPAKPNAPAVKRPGQK